MKKKERPALLKEASTPGRRGYLPPVTAVPPVPSGELIPQSFLRQTALPLPELSEMEVTRHFNALAQRSFGVDQGFYPLGSCTMKYNPKVLEDLPQLPGFHGLHPLQAETTVQGALALLHYAEEVFPRLPEWMNLRFSRCRRTKMN